METTGDEVRARLRAALPAAMRRRDRTAVRAIRSTLAALANAEAVGVGVVAEPAGGPAGSAHVAGSVTGVGATEMPRRQLATHEVHALVRAEIDEREQAADGYAGQGETSRAADLRAEALALRAITD